ncbi:hypothetical protein AMTR_s00034p00167180 [Amborella trichopoda]|uniref:Uncharacterized protein n=1 Tax=Amborella trichopoda TaxID=13333 RepID=W1PWP5_AMBTC|nr:hypothetical protein AMTR_s00034p00167180 [Amborella trichopoda]
MEKKGEKAKRRLRLATLGKGSVRCSRKVEERGRRREGRQSIREMEKRRRNKCRLPLTLHVGREKVT